MLSRYKKMQSTLVYLIAEHARLIIFTIFSILLALIRSCSLNYFSNFSTLLKNWFLQFNIFYRKSVHFSYIMHILVKTKVSSLHNALKKAFFCEIRPAHLLDFPKCSTLLAYYVLLA